MNRADGFLAGLKERRAARFLIGYVIGAWVAAQVIGFFVEQGYIARTWLDVGLFLLVVGFLAAAVWTWFHGERGRQTVTGREITIYAGLSVIAVAGAVFFWTRTPAAFVDPEEVFVELGDRSIAVLPFENELDDPSMAWLDRGVAELLATDLSQVATLRVVGGQRVIDLLRQLGEDEDRAVPEALRTRVTRLAGARYMLTGRIAGSPGNVILIASVTDTRTGEIAAGARHQGGDVFALVDAVSRALLAEALDPEGTSELASVRDMTTRDLEAYAEYQRGREARERFHYAEAAEHFGRAVELDSTFALAHFQLAGVRAVQGDLAGSATSLRMARENLTFASERDRLFIEGLGAMIRGEIDRGAETLRELIERFPDDKEARISLASVLRGRNPIDPEARRLLEETLRLDPGYAVGYNELAYFEARQGNLDSALVLVDQYVRLEPGEPNPIDSKGEILERAGRLGEARDAYRAALVLDPTFTLALRHLVESLLKEDRTDEALAATAAYEGTSDPSVRAIVLTQRAEALFWGGRLDEGLGTLEDAVGAARADPGQLVNIARTTMFANLQLGRYDAALAWADSLARWSPLEGSGEVVAIIEAGERGRIRDADRAADALVRRFRESPDLSTLLGRAIAMTDTWRAFYRGEHERVTHLAAEAPFSLWGSGTEVPGYPVMRSLLALDRGREAVAHVPVARRAGITGIPGQWDSITERILQYFHARALESSGDLEAAIAEYRALVAAWGSNVAGVPLMSDAEARLRALEASG